MVIHSDVYDYDSDGSARVVFRFSQRYLKLMDVIAEKYNNIPDYEEVMVFLLDCYEERPFTWNFNHCKKPKFWFGDRVLLKDSDREGIILGMKWIDEEETSVYPKGIEIKVGWQYQVRWKGRAVKAQFTKEDLLQPIP